MPDDLLLVILCELGERIVAMREILADPSVATKTHARAVAGLLERGLDALEARLQRDVLASHSHSHAHAGQQEVTPDTLDTLYRCSLALRALHCRLGLLDMRWSAAPVDIFLRKLREDVGVELPHPAVVLSDDYAALDHDVAESLYAELGGAGVDVDAEGAMESPIALPRIEAADPLSWPLLLPALARLYRTRRGNRGTREHPATMAEDRLVAVRLIGPAAWAALAAHALAFAPVEAPVWTPYRPVHDAARDIAGGLEPVNDGAGGFEHSGTIGLFERLLRTRDEALGHTTSQGRAASIVDDGWAALDLPEPDVPTDDEAAALLAKLAEGTPINAIDPPVPGDFLGRLQQVDAPDDFYALIGPLGERPAPLAAILGVGWLYKVRYSYPLFGRLVEEHGDIAQALAAYRPHLIERDELLAQSIEAAHVQGIFRRGRLEA